MLNIYLVLGTETVLKSMFFIELVKFLQSHKQLEEVMIQQVRDIAKVSEDWYLTKDQRIDLYIQCAQALDEEKDSNGSFRVYFQAFKLINTLSTKEAKGYMKQAESFVLSALKAPEVINIEEIMLLDAVQELKSSSKDIFNLVDLVVSADMAKFKKELDKYNKLMESNKVSKEMI